MVRVLHSYLNHISAAQRLERIIAGAEKGGRLHRTTPLPKSAKQKTTDQVEQMTELWHQTHNIMEVSRVMNIHESTVRRHLRRAGINTTPRMLDGHDAAEIQRLRDEGHSLRRIAKMTGWSLSSVTKALKVTGP